MAEYSYWVELIYSKIRCCTLGFLIRFKPLVVLNLIIIENDNIIFFYWSILIYWILRLPFDAFNYLNLIGELNVMHLRHQVLPLS